MRSIYIQATIFILLGTTAIAAINSPSKKSDILSPSNSETEIISPSNQPKRLKITLSVTDPQDLKIREGDRVVKGQIISDRRLERQRLQRERMATLLTINKIERNPLPHLKEAPQ